LTKSLRRVETLQRNAIVKTGTGSGKTEAFMLPVISAVLKMRAEGVKGTKAFLLYPMNALANDQLSRLRNLIRDSGVGVTFAMYTGESESVAATLGEPVEGNEFIRRTEIQEQQPDILLTNYKLKSVRFMRLGRVGSSTDSGHQISTGSEFGENPTNSLMGLCS
jgi:ATP-dependent helicase YprA (DUF1998 family)